MADSIQETMMDDDLLEGFADVMQGREPDLIGNIKQLTDKAEYTKFDNDGKLVMMEKPKGLKDVNYPTHTTLEKNC
jgi:hypothetical protein